MGVKRLYALCIPESQALGRWVLAWEAQDPKHSHAFLPGLVMKEWQNIALLFAI